jgi:DNA repair exonuclease SbcCD ATPase subunit
LNLDCWLNLFIYLVQQTRKLHEALRVHILEQKAKIELLHKRYAESQEAISMLEARAKETEGECSDLHQLICFFSDILIILIYG